MNKTIINELIKSVATLQADVEWVKKYIYICVGSSVTAALGALAQLLHAVFTRMVH